MANIRATDKVAKVGGLLLVWYIYYEYRPASGPIFPISPFIVELPYTLLYCPKFALFALCFRKFRQVIREKFNGTDINHFKLNSPYTGH